MNYKNENIKLPQFSEVAFFPDDVSQRTTWADTIEVFCSNAEMRLTPEQLKGAAAVLFLWAYDTKSKKLNLILTKRSPSMPSHKGQVSFAGGHKEADDLTPEQTAVREAEEELGVDKEAVKILGRIQPLLSIDRKIVVPVVAYVESDAAGFVLDTNEIESLVVFPVEDVMAERAREFDFMLYGKRRSSWLFESTGQQIWGLTAKIIKLANLS